MTASAEIADLLADIDATGGYERLRDVINTPPGVGQWAEAWAFATRHRPKPRPRRSRQVRGQRARCAVRVARRDALRP